jgi:hypothetical protein
MVGVIGWLRSPQLRCAPTPRTPWPWKRRCSISTCFSLTAPSPLNRDPIPGNPTPEGCSQSHTVPAASGLRPVTSTTSSGLDVFGIKRVTGETLSAVANATRSSTSTRRVPASMRRRPSGRISRPMSGRDRYGLQRPPRLLRAADALIRQLNGHFPAPSRAPHGERGDLVVQYSSPRREPGMT